jgi:hypothetical protein
MPAMINPLKDLSLEIKRSSRKKCIPLVIILVLVSFTGCLCTAAPAMTPPVETVGPLLRPSAA